jgi:hypothetical protein
MQIILSSSCSSFETPNVNYILQINCIFQASYQRLKERDKVQLIFAPSLTHVHWPYKIKCNACLYVWLKTVLNECLQDRHAITITAYIGTKMFKSMYICMFISIFTCMVKGGISTFPPHFQMTFMIVFYTKKAVQLLHR